MSTKYPGGFITKSPTAPTSTAAPGVWTLEQQAQYQKAGTWPFGGPFTYIEDVFSTWLYTGNGSTQTITNGIDLSTKGGLVWVKGRNLSWDHTLYDTVNGIGIGPLNTATTAAPNPANNQRVTAFNTDGFSLGTNGNVNGSTYTYVSWTFRKQPKFFDIVTYTGDGTNARAINHSLGSVPGCIIVKSTNGIGDWFVYHRSTGATKAGILNSTGTFDAYADYWSNTAPTSTQFTLGTPGSSVTNISGTTYVAYIFAHNAGGFGLTGNDNVISCGSFTTDGSGNATVNLGYEPQWILTRNSQSAGYSWEITDSMRGFITWNGGATYSKQLRPNSANTEGNSTYGPTSTGFTVNNVATSETYIYIAIRRGPMKVPTTGTSVFSPVTQTGAGTVTTNFPVDFVIARDKNGTASYLDIDRLRGSNLYLIPNTTAAEADNGSPLLGFNNSNVGYTDLVFTSGQTPVYWNFRRAPGFFDEVCYTGTGSATTFNHNLGVAPELMIVKVRSATSQNWPVYSAALGATKYVILDQTGASNTDTSGVRWNSTAPTSSVFSVGTGNATNGSGNTYVAYLFATLAGVSKVGSYTGTGTLTTINCGFTGGARFVLVKRTDSTGDWYAWDTARGMAAGTDPSLSLNSTSPESNANSVYTITTGFQLLASPSADVNTNGGSYIYLAIA